MAPKKLSQVDFMLLLLLAELGEASGYALNTVIEERGYRAWAGIGSSSIYTRLRTLEKDGRAVSRIGTEKQGQRGPLPHLYSLTPEGLEATKEKILSGLKETRAHDPLFNLALCGLDLVEVSEATACLDSRRRFLEGEHKKLSAMADLVPDEVLTAKLLFDRILNGIAAEITWLKSVNLEEK